MKIKFQKVDDWLVYIPSQVILDIEQIIQLLNSPVKEILRNHHRSVVEKKEFNNHAYVVKQPNNKNHSLWIRFTTLYRDSEVLKDMKSQLLLTELGIETVTPVVALEKRRFGMVVDSKIIYRYREGREITDQQYPQMINIMNILHKNGYLHDDPHINNFLHEQDVFVIDCKPRKNSWGKFGVIHNLVNLARRSENPDLIYSLIGKNPDKNLDYRLINGFANLQQLRRHGKNKLKKMLGLEYKNKG